jgi:choline dehydrogenase-like flavoprotein
MAIEWTEARRATLKAFADCIFPSLEVQPDPERFWARKASDIGVDLAASMMLDQAPAPVQSGLAGLIDALGASGIAALPQPAQEQLVLAIAASSPEAQAGIVALEQTVLALAYTLTDEHGKNPNWSVLGYPGPLRAAPESERPIKPLELDQDDTTLTADVCIVGSGAGGGVIAGELAKRGLNVVVLEAGGYFHESDFKQLELWAFQNLYWRGGYTPTADGTVSLAAGATLGGGTTVNWNNCVRTPAWVREQWTREYGLEGVNDAAFDRHLQGVLTRIGANDRCSDLNGPHQQLEKGAKKLGYAFRRCLRNIDPAKYDAEVAGFHGFGDVTGARQGTLNTYLLDAFRAGTRIVTRAKATRVLTSAGRASGVVATVTGADGKARTLTVRAPKVVVACGALETPALLLRSGIGGPAAGNYLRLHPVVALSGVYGEDQRAWWGPSQSGLSDQHIQVEDGHGILIECAHHSFMVAAAALPWQSGRQHKELMSELNRYAMFISIVRDRGHGRVEIDASGESVPYYPVQDELDIRNFQRGLRECALLHEAAGAERMLGLPNQQLRWWKRGEKLEPFIAAIAGTPGSWMAQQLFSAHQMGSARMGRDPKSSVAKPTGELHDTRGVWIGDTSAFPTALGVNPMVTCMALAARTAEHIADEK